MEFSKHFFWKYLIISHCHVFTLHVSNSQSVFAGLFHFKFASAFFWVCAMPKFLQEANKRVASFCEVTTSIPKRSNIGKFPTEHSFTKALRHFSLLFERPVPGSTARFLKKQYLIELKKKCRDGDKPEVKCLPTKVCGCPRLPIGL